MPLHKIEDVLSCAESKKTFFIRIERLYSCFSKEHRFIERAYEDAKDAFRDVERDNGDPYLVHVRAVAIILIDYLFIFSRIDLRISAHEILAAALLHDVVEDCPEWSLSRINRDYGRNVAWLLDYVSKRPVAEFGGDKNKQLSFYHGRFVTAPLEFFLIKLADRLHNQLTLWSCDEQKIRNKIEQTKEYYIIWAKRWGILAHELEATTQDADKRIKEHIEQCAIT